MVAFPVGLHQMRDRQLKSTLKCLSRWIRRSRVETTAV